MSDEPKSNRFRATKGSAQLRAFRLRVNMTPFDRNCWRIELDGAATELVVRRIREDSWSVSKTSGAIVARECRSAPEAETVAAHYLFHNGSPTDVP